MSEPPRFSRSDYLQHIHEACALILEYTRGMSKADFLKDRKTQQAVLLNFITIGEAAALLAGEHSAFVASTPQIPWRKMRGMLNVMAHEYWSTMSTSFGKLSRRAFPISVPRLPNSCPRRAGSSR